jgi:hypothetical protein
MGGKKNESREMSEKFSGMIGKCSGSFKFKIGMLKGGDAPHYTGVSI